jgi:hypothetical protein
MNAIDSIRKLFPRAADQKNAAVTGLIPIELFDAMEDSLRPLMREAGLRAMYRGPRPNYDSRHDVPWCARMQPSMTRRCDATGVLMYFVSKNG